MSITQDATQLFREKYQLGKELDEGTFSRVFEAQNKETGERVAIKIIEKSELSNPERAHREVEIMKMCNHPHIVKLIDVFDDPERTFLVMELMQGGSLFDRISSMSRRFTEDEVKVIIRQIVSGLDYLHSKGITHRDLKPENILFKTTDPNSVLKICDFGLAQFAQENDLLATPCGTSGYVAPEVCMAEGSHYTRSVDLWSLGVILYILLCGFPPFDAEDDDTLNELVKEAKYNFPSPAWDTISESAKDLVSRLLEKDPAKRITTKQLLQHPWLKGRSLSKSFDDLKMSTMKSKEPLFSNENSPPVSKDKLIHSLNKSIEIKRTEEELPSPRLSDFQLADASSHPLLEKRKKKQK